MITTVTLWVCSNCGYVDRLDGHASSGQMNLYCPSPLPPPSPDTHNIPPSMPSRQHTLKPVVVVVPYA